MKFAKQLREVDDVFNNKDKFLEFIESKKVDPISQENKPVMTTPPAKKLLPDSPETMIKKLNQLDLEC